MSGIDFFSRLTLGVYVLKNAHIILADNTKKNSLNGNIRGVLILTNMALWNDMLYPAAMPMITPLTLLAITSIKAS